MTRHSRRASPALQALTEADPALAALSLWCRHRDDDTVPGAAETEGQDIRYGPAFDALPLHEQIGLAGHHVLHVALGHSARMAEMALRLGDRFDPELWQIASDALVNQTILAAGHALPRPALTLSDLLRGQGAEVDANVALAEWDCERLYHRLAQTGGEAARRAAQERALPRDLRPESGTQAGAGEDTPPDRAEWHAHLARAMAAGQVAGFGLGVIGHRLADLPRPRTPWEVVLRRLLARAMTDRPRPSPARPARGWLAASARALSEGAPLPPWQPRLQRGTAQPRLVLALDASGSVADDTLALLMAEVTGVARRVRGALHLLVFDEALRIDCPLDPARAEAALRALDLPRGGGTDFAPVLARAVALDASALVILSDMDGPIGPAPPPRFPVIWAAPQVNPPGPPFGRALSLAR